MRLRTHIQTALITTLGLAIAGAPARAAVIMDPQQQPSQSAGQASAPPASPQTAPEDDDAVLNPVEPDFVVVNLPTTMRLPKFKGNFRVTHRFGQNLRGNSFGDNASNLFGLDSGAVVGLEYRFAPVRHLEAVVFRSSLLKTVQFSGKYDALHENSTMPVSLSVLASVEGGNNFREQYAPAFGVVLGRSIANRAMVYAAPVWVHNSLPAGATTENTGYLGLGGRLVIIPTVTITGEVTPRIGGFAPDQPEYGFGLEKRVGGHVFSLTFTNTFGSTFGQLARGGAENTLYLGFNLSRKFF
jgi:hypothetical protein